MSNRRTNHAVAVDRLVGRTIREARAQAGLSQYRLAHMIDVDPSQMSRIESGGYRVTVWMLLRIAHAIGIDYTRLISGDLTPVDRPEDV